MYDSNKCINEALDDLSSRSQRLHTLFEIHGPYAPRKNPKIDAFASLAKTIIYQQLAGKAASSIHTRFTDLFGGSVTPTEVLSMEIETLRTAGLSRAKSLAVLDLARHAQEGLLHLDTLEGLEDDALVAQLCRVRGIGPWTAQMFLIFQLGRLDVWPTGDLAVRRGFAKAFGLSKAPTARELQPMGDPFRPYRSIVAWYCWRVLESPQ